MRLQRRRWRKEGWRGAPALRQGRYCDCVVAHGALLRSTTRSDRPTTALARPTVTAVPYPDPTPPRGHPHSHFALSIPRSRHLASVSAIFPASCQISQPPPCTCIRPPYGSIHSALGCSSYVFNTTSTLSTIVRVHHSCSSDSRRHAIIYPTLAVLGFAIRRHLVLTIHTPHRTQIHACASTTKRDLHRSKLRHTRLRLSCP